ncbi:MAG: hypothetical protein ACLPY1_06625 [Terracidiphilus sp.]
MQRPASISIILSAVLWLAPMITRAQSENPTVLRVRVLDSQTHQPLNGRLLQLTFTNMNGETVSNGLILKGRTGKDGVATFDIAQPIPPRFSIFVWYAVACFRPEDFATQQVIEKGIASASWHFTGFPKLDKRCTPKPNAAQTVQSPGEVEVYVHPQNRFVWAWEDTFR